MAQIVPVARASDVHVARRAAKDMALAIGFDAQVGEEITLAVSELASNLVKHARGGTLTLTPVNDAGRGGMQVESQDRGPGIADVEQAIRNGFSTAGSLGCGLGTVNRLMDRFDITSLRGADAGTTIICTRWLRVDEPRLSPCPLEFGAATRAYPTMTVNGDTFVIKRWQASALIAVIDGVGHGQYAHRAAQTARNYVETHVDQPLDAIFRGVERTCRATRGVVMALVRFDFGADDIRFSFASVGNIEARLFGGLERQQFSIHRGIVGGNAPNPRVTDHRWEPRMVMALHSDGVTPRWRWEDFPDVTKESAMTMAQRLLRRLAKENDDATIVVVRETTRER
jgi:anti-sigma regulatory factor (Ser/Thr protein kinase)